MLTTGWQVRFDALFCCWFWFGDSAMSTCLANSARVAVGQAEVGWHRNIQIKVNQILSIRVKGFTQHNEEVTTELKLAPAPVFGGNCDRVRGRRRRRKSTIWVSALCVIYTPPPLPISSERRLVFASCGPPAARRGRARLGAPCQGWPNCCRTAFCGAAPHLLFGRPRPEKTFLIKIPTALFARVLGRFPFIENWK